MALANGLSSQLLQSLSPSLLAPQAEPAKLFPPALTPSSSSSALTPSSQPLSSPFSLSSILQDKTESIQDLRFETNKVYFKVSLKCFFVNQDESQKTPGSSWAL